MLFKKYEDLAVGIFFTVLGGAGLILACNFSEPVIQVTQAIGSKFMPKLICVIMLVFAVLLIISGILKLRHEGEDLNEPEEDEPEYNRMSASLIAFSVYVLFMDIVGCLIMSILYLPIQIYMLAPEEKQDKKHMAYYILIGTSCSFLIYYTFVYGFRIILPHGLL